MLAVALSVKLPCPTVIETGFGITSGTELAGARSAAARVTPGTCAATDIATLAATTPTSTVTSERRNPRTLLATSRIDLIVFMNQPPGWNGDRFTTGVRLAWLREFIHLRG